MSQKHLVIVESPAKAKTINKYLGNQYIVSASVGHIIDLPKSKLGVNIENGFKPEYVKIRGKEKIIKQLRSDAKKSSDVFIATDPDREGEAIAFHIASVLNKTDDKIHRVEFNEITRSAVDKAMQSPRPIDMLRVYSQQARRVLDRIVGYKISPFLWQTIYRGLSAGRVQSVALRLICERQAEINKFQPQEFWTISALLSSEGSDPFESKLFRIAGKKAHIPDKESAETHEKAIKQLNIKITSLKKKELKRNPQPPFITSTLQQTASRLLRMSTKRIMGIAQSLYEGVEIPDQGSVGLITYMRTDSVRISEDALKQTKEYIEQEYGTEYGLERHRYFRSKKSAQDAHEAVRPTYISKEFSPEALKKVLTPEQFRLYNLIWKRFTACQMAAARIEKTVVLTGDDTYEFKTEGEVTRFPGFTKVYQDDPDENSQSKLPPNLMENADCELLELTPEQNFTKPLPRFTEATLVKELDRLEIGRPSTYAQIVSTILQRKYVELKERKLWATELGETVSRILVKNFPEIFNVTFTARMEEELDKIAQSEISYENVLNDFYSPLDSALKIVKEKKGKIKSELIEEPGEICEKCGKPMLIRWGKNGRFLACSGFPECKNAKPLNGENNTEESDEKCPKCGKVLLIKEGKFGKFLACSNYPECRYTKPLSLGIECPKDECGGEIIQRQSRRGKVFYGCSKYPKCDFASWDKPLKQTCPECENYYMTEKTTKKKGTYLYCPKCRHQLPAEELDQAG